MTEHRKGCICSTCLAKPNSPSDVPIIGSLERFFLDSNGLDGNGEKPEYMVIDESGEKVAVRCAECRHTPSHCVCEKR